MLRILAVLVLAVALIGCQEATTKVLIGGTMIPSPGATPVEDSIIVIEGGVIRAAGLRKDVPVPQDSERTDLTGKWVLPDGAGSIEPGQPANLRIYNQQPSSSAGAPDRRIAAGHWQP